MTLESENSCAKALTMLFVNEARLGFYFRHVCLHVHYLYMYEVGGELADISSLFQYVCLEGSSQVIG